MDAVHLDPAALARLEGLCRLWGVVRFLHPDTAPSDAASAFDTATLQTIRTTLEAASQDAYRCAVRDLLGTLGDPATCLWSPRRESKPAASASQWRVVSTDDAAAVLTHRRLDGDARTEHPGLHAALRNARASRGLVIDLRGCDWFATNDLRSALGTLIDADGPLPGERFRIHSGYTPDESGSSGGYYSGTVVTQPEVIRSTPPRAEPRRIAVIVDSGSAYTMPLAAMLARQRRATVVHAGEVTPPGAQVAVRLADDVVALVRTSEWIFDDGSVGFVPDVVVGEDAGAGDYLASPAVRAAIESLRAPSRSRTGPGRSPRAGRAVPSPEAAGVSLTAEVRLLAAFRLWTAIWYFFPYQHLLDTPWHERLPQLLCSVAAASTELDYGLAITEAATWMQDSHAGASGPLLTAHFGSHEPPVGVVSIDGGTYVTHAPPPLEPGDEVLAVDGEPAQQRRSRLERVYAASTPQALLRKVDQRLLHGAEGSDALVRVRKGDGRIVEATIKRSVEAFRPPRSDPVFRVLPEGAGYIDLTRLSSAEVDDACQTVRATPGLVIDIRGYPRGTIWALAPKLARRRAVAARFRRPELRGPDDDSRSWLEFEQVVEPAGVDTYAGRVVVLIDENAGSQSEHTCLYLEAACDATFVGSPTNGTNGDVTRVALPGGLLVAFTGHDVRHGDGRQLQRVGITPHVYVRPTVDDLRNGRDVVLQTGVRVALSPEGR